MRAVKGAGKPNLFKKIQALLQDPPPEFAFEVAADAIAMSRTRPPATMQTISLPAGVVVPSPVKDNVRDPAAFAEAVRALVPGAGSGSRRTTALILPDNSMRHALVDFDTLPDKEEDRVALIKFRLRKTLPFDIDEAAFSYHVQLGNKVLAAVTPREVIARYEAPFRAVGLQPGLVISSSIALLDVLPEKGSVLVAHLSPGSLTVLALDNGVVTLTRSLELIPGTADPLEEISAALYPTLVYIEDQTGARPDRIILAGFDAVAPGAAVRLGVELEIAVEPLKNADSALAAFPGLGAYLWSLGLFPSGFTPEHTRAA